MKPSRDGYRILQVTRNRWEGIYPPNGEPIIITRHVQPDPCYILQCPNTPKERYRTYQDVLRAINTYIPPNIIFWTFTDKTHDPTYIARYHPSQTPLQPPGFRIRSNPNSTYTLRLKAESSNRYTRIATYYQLQDCMQIAQYLYDTDGPIPFDCDPPTTQRLKEDAYRHPVKTLPAFNLRTDLPYSGAMAKPRFGRMQTIKTKPRSTT